MQGVSVLGGERPGVAPRPFRLGERIMHVRGGRRRRTARWIAALRSTTWLTSSLGAAMAAVLLAGTTLPAWADGGRGGGGAGTGGTGGVGFTGGNGGDASGGGGGSAGGGGGAAGGPTTVGTGGA